MKKNLLLVAVICATLFASCGDNKGLQKGSLSKFDSLSYALGVNIGEGTGQQFADIPFNYNEVDKGLEDSAFDKSKMTKEESTNIVQDYFMTKKGPRAEAIAARNAADSTITPVVADPDMFSSEEERDSVSYALGSDIGANIKDSKLPLHMVWVIKAMKDSREGNATMTNEEAIAFLQNYFTVVIPAENKEASDKFLAKIEKKSGVKKTESGILYKITREGDSELIATDDRDVVLVNYKGTTRLEKQFDSSYKESVDEDGKTVELATPVEFPLNRVIPGWTEGMKLVGKGGAITLWIPAELAYGERGAGRDIGANEALRFDVEIVDVKPFVEPVVAPATEEAAE